MPKSEQVVERFLTAAPKSVSIEDIRDFIKKERTWMDLEEEDDKSLLYTTRDHGDMENDEPGREDLNHAKALGRAVLREFGRAVKVELDYIDEWTQLTIELR